MSEQIPFDNMDGKKVNVTIEEDKDKDKHKKTVKCRTCPIEFLPSNNFKGRNPLCGLCRRPEAIDAKQMVQFSIPMDIEKPKYHPPQSLFRMAEYSPTQQLGLGFSHPNPNNFNARIDMQIQDLCDDCGRNPKQVGKLCYECHPAYNHPFQNKKDPPLNCMICLNKVDIYLIPDNLAFCKSCYDAQGRIREYSPPVHQHPKVCECSHPKVLEIFKDGEPTFCCGECNKPL
jgi:hypothetical protein